MKVRRLLAAGVCLLALAGCDVLRPGPADRAPGRYRMTQYGGRPLPAVVSGAAGNRVELLSGEMELRRNFRWVLTTRLDSVASGVRHEVVRADSGTFGFPVADVQKLAFYGRDGTHPATLVGNTLDVHWGNARHDVYIR
ncbi:MAG: hypothetical protein KY444_05800 [Gemmatimonadetes bacterium]|nr:hypothetical protein [Gemmatimonadota bacterium]